MFNRVIESNLSISKTERRMSPSSKTIHDEALLYYSTLSYMRRKSITRLSRIASIEYSPCSLGRVQGRASLNIRDSRKMYPRFCNLFKEKPGLWTISDCLSSRCQSIRRVPPKDEQCCSCPARPGKWGEGESDSRKYLAT